MPHICSKGKRPANMLIALLLTCCCTLARLAATEDARNLPELDYVQKVFSDLTTDDAGRPKDLENGPTSVWFLQDSSRL